MDDGKIYEGLSSNFGIICGGTLITAPNLLVCSLEILTFKTGCLLSPLTQDPALPYSPDQQILEGTVLSVVVTACTRLGIPVRRELPTVEMLEHCEAAFISSTTRRLLFIDTLNVIDVDGLTTKQFHFSPTLVGEKLLSETSAVLKESSTQINRE
eukprot:TRINITY_DN1781_c0_g1_i3.p1 TRINITY_DN1781_c0_g1~~TRINITY_DN1781_c0_g1_i3.p1  ORF type:complete len:155 (+),score=20.27 TRINITY_DN1781_c0_g1_i3:261-725(+)